MNNSREMRYFLIVATSLLACTSLAQDFVPESSDDCLDRFQSMALKVTQRYAVVGRATLSRTDLPHLSKTFEWFACEDAGNVKSPRRFYAESRILYPHAPTSNVWERRHISGNKMYRSLGDLVDPLYEVKKKEDEEEEKFLSRATVGCPNLFAVAVLAPSEFTLLAESSNLIKVLNQHKITDA